MNDHIGASGARNVVLIVKRTRRAPTRALRKRGQKSARPRRAESNPCDDRDDLDTPVESFVRAMARELALDPDVPADYRTRRQMLRLARGRRGRAWPSIAR